MYESVAISEDPVEILLSVKQHRLPPLLFESIALRGNEAPLEFSVSETRNYIEIDFWGRRGNELCFTLLLLAPGHSEAEDLAGNKGLG